MSNFVFVHGGNVSAQTWNELSKGSFIHTHDGRMWGRVWDLVFPPLLAENHKVYCIDLIDEYETNLTGHVEQVSRLIEERDLKDVILVGHSYGGMIITGVAGGMTDRINHLIYMDAAVPESGQSLFDIIKSGGRDPLSFIGLEPAPPYLEKLHFDDEKIKTLKKTYIRCTKSQFLCVTEVARQKIKAEEKNWDLQEIESSHLPMVEIPDELAKLLIAAVNK